MKPRTLAGAAGCDLPVAHSLHTKCPANLYFYFLQKKSSCRPCLNLLPLKRRDLWSDPATRLSESSLKLPPKINAKLSFNLCQGLRLLQFPKSYSTIATSPVVSLDSDPEKGDREERWREEKASKWNEMRRPTEHPHTIGGVTRIVALYNTLLDVYKQLLKATYRRLFLCDICH